MKACLIILITALTSGCVAFNNSPSNVDKDWPTECPYGHTSLKKVPIIYGLLQPSEKLNKSIENYEFLTGGCVVSPNSPKHAIRCTTCNFIYNPPEDDWDSAYWSRRSTEIKSFKHNFPSLLLSFPIPSEALLIEKPKYSQIYNDGSASMSFIQFSTTEKLPIIKQRIDIFLSNNNLSTRYYEQINSTDTQQWRDTYEWETSDSRFGIKLHHETNNICWIFVSEAP